LTEDHTHPELQILATEGVYEPAEDSHLIIDAALKAIDRDGHKRMLRILEIGTGSGIVSSAMMRHAPMHFYAATDISPHAVACARRNGVQVVRADLFAGLSGRFDLIVFNPVHRGCARVSR